MKYIRGNWWFYALSLIAIILLVASFIIPPTGIIDSSVLAATGEIFAFGSLGTVIKAIDKGIDAKLSKGNTTIEINND